MSGTKMTSKNIFCCLGALFCSVVSASDVDRQLGTLTFKPCTLSQPDSSITVEAQCTKFEVPENRAAPQARKIKLAIAWVPSDHPEPASDPVLMLAGGPGQSALQSYPGLASAFARILRKRHIILIDQRGTGDSNPLLCRNRQGQSAVTESLKDTPQAAAEFARDCAQQLQTKADVRYYSTTQAVDDLDAVREALNIDKVNLVGVSYGTRVAQQYARKYAEHTRSLVLDGVVPNDLVLGGEHAQNLEAALDQYFARCAKVPQCHERFGSPRVKLDELLGQLRQSPMMVRYRDPLSGEERHESFDAQHLGAVVRMFAYSPQMAAILPLSLHEAQAGRPEQLMAQSQMINSVLGEQIMHGMQLSVMCTEDADDLKVDPSQNKTVMGNALIEFLLAQCKVWPHGARPESFREPLRTDIPILILSGEFDPVTPPRYGEQVLKGLSQGRHLVARGAGHNVFPIACISKIATEFINTAKPASLNVKCLDHLNYVAPFTGHYGWEP
jgi:pimeloyl-ACP methyl ester carboxylesterase